MKMQVLSLVSIALTATMLSTPIHAGVADAATDPAAQAVRAAVSRATGLAPDKVRPSNSLPGYYEIEVKGALAYVDPAGKRLIRGEVIDLSTGENLTTARQSDAPARIDVASLPVGDALKTVSGSGARRLYVFVDPNCTFCKQLEPELMKVSDATIYRFVLPVLGPGSLAKARQIWCAPNREAAWSDAVVGRSPGTQANCDDGAITRNAELARKLGIRATPTIVFASGERVAATMTKSQIEERMNAKVEVARSGR